MSHPRRAAYRTPAVWGLSFAVATIMGLLNAGSEVVNLIARGGNYDVWEPITWELTSNYSFALLVPFVIEFALRVRPPRSPTTTAMPEPSTSWAASTACRRP